MNKKGFTTVELILTILLVIIIMGTVAGVTYTYRDRSNYEKTLTDVIDYKNTVTKIIYDDILNRENPALKITQVSDKEYILERTSDSINLKIIEEDEKVGILYNGIEYLVPGSEDGLVEVYKYTDETENYQVDEENGYSSLEILFEHANLENLFKIRFVVILEK